MSQLNEKKNHNSWLAAECIPGLVSVIIPSYNCAHYLADAMNSVFSQSYRPIELIVVNDGSTDNTKEVIEEWRHRCTDDNQFKFHYLHQNNKGACAARNYGLSISKGSYIQFLDSDDILSPNKITRQVAVLASCDDNTAAYGPVRYFENIKNELAVYDLNYSHYKLGEDKPLQRWIEGDFIPNHSLLWNRNDIQNIGPWDETLAADQDGEFAMRFLAAGGSLIFCEKAWIYYRQSPNYKITKDHVSRSTASASVRSRIRVTRRIENFLANRGLLDDEYRTALSRRYFEIAKNWTMGNKKLRQLCLKNFKRLISNQSLSKQFWHRLLRGNPGLILMQKLRFVVRGIIGIQAYLPAIKARTIGEMVKLDD